MQVSDFSVLKAPQIIRTRDNVAHTHHQLLLCDWNILTHTGKEPELVEEAKRYHTNIIGFSSTKRRGARTVDLAADGSSSILVLILVCLLKRVWEFSQAPAFLTVCQIGFFYDHGSVC